MAYCKSKKSISNPMTRWVCQVAQQRWRVINSRPTKHMGHETPGALNPRGARVMHELLFWWMKSFGSWAVAMPQESNPLAMLEVVVRKGQPRNESDGPITVRAGTGVTGLALPELREPHQASRRHRQERSTARAAHWLSYTFRTGSLAPGFQYGIQTGRDDFLGTLHCHRTTTLHLPVSTNYSQSANDGI